MPVEGTPCSVVARRRSRIRMVRCFLHVAAAPRTVDNAARSTSSDTLIDLVRRIWATDAACCFSDLLDAVEHRGEEFTIVQPRRRSRTTPARRGGTGRTCEREMLRWV